MRITLRALAAALAPVAMVAAATAAAPQAASGATTTYKLAYASLPNGSKPVLRWNPCQKAITWKVNLAAVPSAYRSTVLSETKSAVTRISKATRIPFSYKGTTSEVPQPGTAAKQSAEIIIAWTTPAKTRYYLYGATAGQGGFSYAWASRWVNGRTTYTYAAQRGFVVLDTPQSFSQLRGGFGSGLRRTNLLIQQEFLTLELFTVASIYYLIMTSAWSVVQGRLEARFGRGYARDAQFENAEQR